MNKLNEFKTGGTHGENPIGGIPQGKNSNGTMNTVEQGETKYGDFVFSNRFKVDKKLLSEFNLPGYIKDKTYADASKAIDNKFKDRNDKVSNETKNELLSRLSKAHEYVKMQETLKANASEVEDQMNGQVPEGFEDVSQNKMFLGGETGGAMNMTDSASTMDMMGKVSGGMGTISSMGSSIMPLISLSQGTASPKAGMGALEGATTGAMTGSAFGPYGAAIGATVGVGTGLLGAHKTKKNMLNNAKDSAYSLNSKYNQYAFGGNLGNGEGTLNDKDLTNSLVDEYKKSFSILSRAPQLPTDISSNIDVNDTTAMSENGFDKLNAEPSFWSKLARAGKNTGKSILNYAKEDGGQSLRYAPILANYLQYKNLKQSVQESLQRLNTTYQPKYVDEQSLVNTVNNDYGNTVAGLTNVVNGSTGALRSNLLAAQSNKAKALSEAFLSASERNRQENQAKQQFNLGVNQFNIGQSNSELDINDRNKAAYENNKSKLLSQFATDIGMVGKEAAYSKMAEKIFGYNRKGEYIVDKDGNIVPNEKVQQQVDAALNQTQNLFGGYLKNKKK